MGLADKEPTLPKKNGRNDLKPSTVITTECGNGFCHWKGKPVERIVYTADDWTFCTNCGLPHGV